MSKKAKTLLKIFGIFVSAVIVFAVCLVGWLSVREFDPDEVVTLEKYQNLTEEEYPSENISLCINTLQAQDKLFSNITRFSTHFFL